MIRRERDFALEQTHQLLLVSNLVVDLPFSTLLPSLYLQTSHFKYPLIDLEAKLVYFYIGLLVALEFIRRSFNYRLELTVPKTHNNVIQIFYCKCFHEALSIHLSYYLDEYIIV